MELRNFAPLNPYLIAENAPLELITLLSEGSSRGISVKTNVERVYGVPGYASHILGRVGKIQPDKTEYYDSLGYSAFQAWKRLSRISCAGSTVS